MYKLYTILTFKPLLILIIIAVVSNQVIDDFDVPKIWFDKNGKRMAEPPEYSSLKAPGDSTQLRSRGMVTDIKAYIKCGLCISNCIWKYRSDCPGAISCSWKCIAPPDEMPTNSSVIDKQNDKEIEFNSADTGGPTSEDLTPINIVNFFICLMKCMKKYMPYTKTRLQQFIICLSFRCFCRPK